MSGHKALMLGCSLAALGGAANAQETVPGQVGEVVVTAQRRSESVQDVPISINVFSQEKLEAAAVQSLPQLAQLTPGLQFQAIGATETPFLRGVGNTISLAGSESTVALVVDGVYISAQAAILKSLASIEAIEVDRGPQGTLFGRNATGGVIQIRTRDPGPARKLDMMVGYGNFDTWEGSIYGSAPISDTLASDISVSARHQDDGWGVNLFNGDDVFKGYDYALRSKSVWRPGEATKVAVILDYEKVRSQHGFATRLPLNGEFGYNQAGRNGFVFTGGFYDVNADFKSGNTTKTGGGSVDWSQDLGLATFRSISAYHQQKWVGTVDFDNTPFPGSHQTFSPDIETYSQEFQLLSPPEGPLTWVLGSYLYRDVSHYAPTFIDYPAGAVVSDTTIDGKLFTNSWALFGQGTYALTEATRFTAGVRYTEDRRRIRNTQSSLGPVPGPLTQTGKDTFPKVTYRFALDHRFTEQVMAYVQVSRGFKSGLFNNQTLQPANSASALVIKPETLDAYEAGFKSDLFDRRLRLNVSAFHYNYQDQQVSAFTGTTRIILNAASSKIDGLDLELVATPTNNLTLTVTGELLDAKYKDFPGAPRFTPAAGPPPLIGNIVTPTDASGNRVVNSPRFTGTFAVDYTVPLEAGKLVLSANLYHNSGYYFDFANLRRHPSFQLLSGSAKFIVGDDGRWDVSIWGNNLLGQEIYASNTPFGLGPQGLFGGDAVVPRAPRTFGVRVGAHF